MTTASKDYKAIGDDIEMALKHRSPSEILSPSISALYGTKAKIDFGHGDFATVLEDLDTAVNADPSNPNEALNTGTTKPEDSSNPTLMNLADYNSLVLKFPNDYRRICIGAFSTASFHYLMKRTMHWQLPTTKKP